MKERKNSSISTNKKPKVKTGDKPPNKGLSLKKLLNFFNALDIKRLNILLCWCTFFIILAMVFIIVMIDKIGQNTFFLRGIFACIVIPHLSKSPPEMIQARTKLFESLAALFDRWLQ